MADESLVATEFPMTPQTVLGVDYSGAARSGVNAWLSVCEILPDKTLRLLAMDPIGRLAGSDDRDDVNAYLVGRVRSAAQTLPRTLIGMDFPFGLPVQLELGDWPDQLRLVVQFNGAAPQFGRELVARTQRLCGGQKHVRRQTDRDTATPFDCYHYRIIYQTFHGIRDVLAPIADDPSIAVIPFQPVTGSTQTVVAEGCPSSTLKRLGLPHQNYKQTAGRPPQPKHIATRQTVLRGIGDEIQITRHRRRVLLANPGGDALDSVLAALGVWHAYRHSNHQTDHDCPIASREGKVYA